MPTDPSPKSPFATIRQLIAVIVAYLNVHSNSEADLAAANAKNAELSAQLAAARAEADAEKATIAAEGDPLTAAEEEHLQSVLAQLGTLPAPVVPVPQPPPVLDPTAPQPPPEPAPSVAPATFFSNPFAP